jgi:hypothetical protein
MIKFLIRKSWAAPSPQHELGDEPISMAIDQTGAGEYRTAIEIS